jgi:hypothetical protein
MNKLALRCESAQRLTRTIPRGAIMATSKVSTKAKKAPKAKTKSTVRAAASKPASTSKVKAKAKTAAKPKAKTKTKAASSKAAATKKAAPKKVKAKVAKKK